MTLCLSKYWYKHVQTIFLSWTTATFHARLCKVFHLPIFYHVFAASRLVMSCWPTAIPGQRRCLSKLCIQPNRCIYLVCWILQGSAIVLGFTSLLIAKLDTNQWCDWIGEYFYDSAAFKWTQLGPVAPLFLCLPFAKLTCLGTSPLSGRWSTSRRTFQRASG